MVLEHRRLGAAHHVAAILLASVLGLFAQNAPILRNSWSTNAAGTPVQGADNLSVTNLGSGTNWQFFNVGPKTVARLSDVSNIVTAVSGSVTNALSIISSNGVVVASGVTNLDLVGGTNIDWKITNSPAGYVHAAPHVNMAAIQTVVNTSSNSLYGVSSNITIAVGTGATNYAAGTANNVSNWVNAVSNRLNSFSAANSNQANTFSVAASNLSYAIGTASTNYASGTANNVSNWVNAVSNRLNTFSVNNSNLSWEIGTAATNYAAGTANNVSNWVNAVSNRFDGFSVNNSNLSWSIGANGTNFTYSIGANATSFVYSIGQNNTNFTLNIATNKIDNTNGFGTNLTVYGPFFIDPNATPSPGQIWTATNANGSGTWSNAPVAAGASPGGASFMLQFNNAGSFAGMTNTGATNSTGTVGMSNLVLSGNLDVAGTQTVSVLETPMIFLTGVTQGLAYFAAAQTNLTNLPFGTGMLTNKGDGTMGWMAIPAGGAGALQTNANQFGANVVLNIKDGASVTNTTNFGNFTTMTNMDWKGGRVTHIPLNSDIQTYANNALAGDTLILGSGTYTQNTSIVITNQMNIVGQGSAGWVTDPTTESHGTRIATISGNNVTMFDVRTNNVRFSTFSIWMTNGANRVGIAVSSNLQGIVVRNVDIMMDGGTPQCGIVVNSSDTTLRECTIYANSANGTAYGLLLSNGPTSSISSTCDVFGLVFSAQGSGAGNNAYGILCTNSGSANSLVLNLAYTQVRSPAAASVTNIALASMGPAAIVNSFMSTLDGADYDVIQEGGSTLSLGGSVVVNNLIQGTPTYRAVMVSGAVTTTNLSMLGPALSFSASASNAPAMNEFPTAQWVSNYFLSSNHVFTGTNVFGFVGIGTNPPFAKLHVGHPINTNAMFQVDSTNGYVFVIKTNGYVGIGTNNPQIPLEIIGQTLAGGPDATIDQPHSLLRLGQYANNVMDFGIGPNGYGWIQGLNRHVAGIYYPITLNPVPGSQVGIGTNYMTGTAILHVVGDNSLDDLLRIGTTNADNVFVITTNSTLFMYSKFTNTSAYARTYISNNAAMTIGNTSIGGATNKPIVFRIGALDAFRIETNGTLVGNLVNSVGSNGIVYAATNINFVGNTKITNVNGLISVDVTPGTGGTPTTTLGDMIVRGAAADERLPVGGFGDRLIVINGVPTWVDTATKLYVNDGFLRPVSSSAIGTLDGCASISGSVAMDQVRPTTMGVGRNGFCRIRHAAASATVNVMGCTTIASGDSWIMTNGVYLSSDLVFETSSTGMVCQVGLLGVQATSNQTAGIFFEKQPEATGEGTWHIRTVGVQNTNIALGLVASQTEWLKLEMIGTTNSMLFKTNGVAAFTNNASATMPSGITLLPGVLTMTNGVAGVAQVLWLDYFKVIEY